MKNKRGIKNYLFDNFDDKNIFRNKNTIVKEKRNKLE